MTYIGYNTLSLVSFILPRDARRAKRGIAIVSRPSVRPSVRDVDVYHGSMCWVSSKLIAPVIGLGSSLLAATTSSPRGTLPKFGWNMGELALLSRKPAISLKSGKIGRRLMFMTNWKSHTRFRLVLKSMTLDDLERPFRTMF